MKASLLFLLLLFPALLQDDSVESLLSASQDQLLQMKSVEYEVKTKFKFFDDDDTVYRSGQVRLLRNPQDSFLFGLIWIRPNDSTIKLYDGTDFYWLNTEKKTGTRYLASEETHGAFSSYGHDGLIWQRFLRPERLMERYKEAGEHSRLPDTIINGALCHAIRLDFIDYAEYSNHSMWYYITALGKMPVFFRRQIMFQGNYQYEEFLVSNYKFNTLKEKDFSSRKYRSFKIKDHEPESEADKFVFLDSLTPAPLVYGNSYFMKMQPDTIDFEGKVTLLDFWYMSCYPCIQAIPEMNKLHEKYKGKSFQIYGVNTFDKEEKRLERLPKFFEYNPVRYPVLMVENTIPLQYQVRGWPTVYLIDQEGRVVYSHAGFSPETAIELSALIDRLLE